MSIIHAVSNHGEFNQLKVSESEGVGLMMDSMSQNDFSTPRFDNRSPTGLDPRPYSGPINIQTVNLPGPSNWVHWTAQILNYNPDKSSICKQWSIGQSERSIIRLRSGHVGFQPGPITSPDLRYTGPHKERKKEKKKKEASVRY